MIRLGSLAGYSFDGPRLLAGWTAPHRAAVYAIFYRPEAESRPERFGVIYVGHTEDLSRERFPFGHAAASRWLERVDGDRYKLYIGILEAPGATAAHRDQIAKELIAIYKPGCNLEQFDQAWEEHWIGEYQAPGTTGPLTTDRDPSGSR